MSPSLSAKLKEQDDEFHSRVVELSAHGKSILTPERALTLGNPASESIIVKNPQIRGLNEVVRMVDEQSLDDIDHDVNKMRRFIQSLQNGLSRINREDEISFFVYFYESEGRMPSSKQIDYLANLTSGSPYNDIIAPPIVRGITGEQYVEYLRLFFKSLKSYVSNPQIMGTIPHLAHIELPDICDFYKDIGTTVFALDLGGKNPMDMFPNVNEVYRAMLQIESTLTGEECCYLHGLNVRRPRGLLKKNLTPAKDILVFEMGFNSFGSSHLRPKMKPDVWQKFSEAKVAWVFDRSKYVYFPTTGSEVHAIAEESHSSLSLADVLSSSDIKSKAKMFNVERQGLEAGEVRRVLLERELPKYLQTKTLAGESLKQIKKKMPPASDPSFKKWFG
jgi:hypothetical protein